MEKHGTRRKRNLVRIVCWLLIVMGSGTLGYLIGSGYVTFEW